MFYHFESAEPGRAPAIRSTERLELLRTMELFIGEIVQLKVAAALDRPNFAEAYAIIRKRDDSLAYLIVEFYYHDGRWLATQIRNPFFRATSRIEFQPQKGDASKILKTHLGSAELFRAVEGKPGHFDVVDFDVDAESAKNRANANVLRLQESLKKFGLDTALKVISTAEKPETPYMAEDAPPFIEPKP